MIISKKFNSLQAKFLPYVLHFKKPSGTSRGVLLERPVWFLIISAKDNPTVNGIGECAPLKDLSIDDLASFENILSQLCEDIPNYQSWLANKFNRFPSIKFGLETALLDLQNSGQKILFESDFTQGEKSITINGLIWMGNHDEMKAQLEQKVAAGFRCIKMKIGAIDFEKELSLLKFIRSKFPKEQIELRVDANGAFSPKEALGKLDQLANLDIHSIEQPIKQGQREEMARLCKQTPLPIALDEELIGITTSDEKKNLLDEINPQYIILKPTLIGGFAESEEWIRLAEQKKIGWWITSALESNIGLNAIAQWTYTLKNPLPQGLGTGQLYTNNFESPLFLKRQELFYDPKRKWELPFQLT